MNIMFNNLLSEQLKTTNAVIIIDLLNIHNFRIKTNVICYSNSNFIREVLQIKFQSIFI